MHRYPIKQLQEMSDNLLTRSIINERINGLTNPYSPLSERLNRLVNDIQKHLPETFAPKKTGPNP